MLVVLAERVGVDAVGFGEHRAVEVREVDGQDARRHVGAHYVAQKQPVSGRHGIVDVDEIPDRDRIELLPIQGFPELKLYAA